MKKEESWEAKKHTAFSYSFTPREFFYFLFRKPKCSRCGERMVRKKEFFSTKGALPGTFTDELGSVNVEKVKYYYYTYTCPGCGARFTLRELAGGRR